MADIFDEIESVPIEPTEKEQQVAHGFKFFGYEPKPESVAEIRKPLVQKVLYPGTEFLSSVLGMSGDVASLLHTVIAKPLAEMITGKEEVPYEQSPLGQILGTSEKIHQMAEQAAGEKIRPESVTDELLGTTAGFLGSMFGSGALGLAKPGVIPFTSKTMPASVKTVLSAFAPAAAFVGAKKADLPPWMQASAAIGTSILTHKATNKSIKQLSNELFNTRNSLSKDVLIPGGPVSEDFTKLYAEMQKGGSTSVENHIMKFLNPLKAKAEGGDVLLDELIAARSKLFQESKMFTRKQIKGTERFWDEAERILDRGIKNYKNPEFQRINTEANSLYKGIKESQKIEEWIKNNKTLAMIAGSSGGLAVKLLSYAMSPKPITVLLGIKGLNFTKALIKNPGFRKAWKDILKNASNENVRGTARALKSFNQIGQQLDLTEEPEKKDIFDELD